MEHILKFDFIAVEKSAAIFLKKYLTFVRTQHTIYVRTKVR